MAGPSRSAPSALPSRSAVVKRESRSCCLADSHVIDFNQIADAPHWLGMAVVVGVSRRGGLLFRCDYGVHRRCGVGARLVQHLSDGKWASSLSPCCDRSDSHGGGDRTTALTGCEKSIAGKGRLTGRCRSGHKKKQTSQTESARPSARLYGYGNALGYAQESGYSARGLFFR